MTTEVTTAYAPDWLDISCATEVRTVVGFGTAWLVAFPMDEDDDEQFEPGQEEDEREAKEDAVSRSYTSRYLVVRGDGSEVWTSTEKEADRLLGAANTLFG